MQLLACISWSWWNWVMLVLGSRFVPSNLLVVSPGGLLAWSRVDQISQLFALIWWLEFWLFCWILEWMVSTRRCSTVSISITISSFFILISFTLISGPVARSIGLLVFICFLVVFGAVISALFFSFAMSAFVIRCISSILFIITLTSFCMLIFPIVSTWGALILIFHSWWFLLRGPLLSQCGCSFITR